MIHPGELQREFLMLRSLTILIIICMIGPPVLRAAVYQPGYSSSYALVVGINKYDHWPSLEYAAKDAAEIARIDGNVELGKLTRGKRQLIIRDPENDQTEEHLVPVNKHLTAGN